MFSMLAACAVVTCLTFFLISDGQRILSCGADQFMKVLDVHTGTEVYSKDVGEEIRCVRRGCSVLYLCQGQLTVKAFHGCNMTLF